MDPMSEDDRAGLAKLAEMIDEARIAMLTTLEPGGALRSRPLATLQVDPEGCIWFFTAESSPKVGEMQQHREVNLSYADADEQDYVSVSGTAELVHDRAKMQQLWTPWVKAWFPNGLDDPDLALLKVRIDSAEYWDAPSSTVRRLYGLAKALATGDHGALGEHGRLSGGAPPHG